MRPKVSVITPAYNGERTIRGLMEALASLAPDSPPHEILVADNGSKDRTPEIVREFLQVKLIDASATRGASAARNAGAQAATGEFLAFTDQDCVPCAEWLKAGLSGFKDDGVAIVGGPLRGTAPKTPVQEWMNSRQMLDPEWILTRCLRPYIQTANVFFRRQDFFEVGGADPAIPFGGDDCDLCWRILDATGGRIEYAREAVVLHDHRCSVKGLLRQAVKNAQGGAYLRLKWGDWLPRKNLKTSLWECYDLLECAGRWFTCAGSRERFMAGLDALHRMGIKWGTIVGAWKTKQWSEW